MSTLNVSNITDGTDTVETGYVLNGSAKVWANIDQTSTQSINGSLNVSSVTDLSLGHTTVNFSSAMSDSNFSFVASAKGSNARVNTTASPSSASSALIRNYRIYSSEGYKDEDPASASVHGDLA